MPGSAAAMHTRAQPSQHVIDLRQSESMVAKIPLDTVAHTAEHHDTARTPAPQPHTAMQEHHIARFTDKFDRAKQFGRSPLVRKFGEIDPEKAYDKFGNKTLEALEHTNSLATPTQAPADHKSSHHAAATSAMPSDLPHLAATQHEAMAHLPQPAPAPAPKPASSPRLHGPGTSRFLTTAAAVAIMSGYIWLQNYPKLALQSASAKAGIAASLPGFVPSSYNLVRTDTGSGQVTLSFASPSVPEPLTIDQQRTSWDSSSLLDNFVAKKADAYSTALGQGLTIYLYGANKATWVNHGVWYSIDGASRLSRDQILKIAYSL
jgi:hypothetical protein